MKTENFYAILRRFNLHLNLPFFVIYIMDKSFDDFDGNDWLDYLETIRPDIDDQEQEEEGDE